jgi:hypothetical protein
MTMKLRRYRYRIHLLTAGLLWTLFLFQPLALWGEPSNPSVSRNDEIDQLKRQMQAIDKKLERLEMLDQAPSSSSGSASKEATSLTDQPIFEQGIKAVAKPIEQLERMFRGETAYLEERIGILERQFDRRVGMSMYLTTEFEAFQHRNAEFAGAKLELFPSIKLTDRIRAFGEFEFNSTIDSGGGNPNERGKVELDQGWIEYAVNEQLKPRVGVVLVPFGRYNLSPFDPVQEFTSRPIFAKKIIPTVWSETAAGFTGRATLGSGLGVGWFKDVAVEYQAYVMNGLDNHISDQEGLREARGAFHRDNNNSKAVVGRLLTKLMPGLEIGVSGYYGSYDQTGKKMRGVDVDLKLTRGPFEVLVEAANFDLDPGGISVSPSHLNQRVPAYLRGGYIEGRYRFWIDGLKDTWLGRGFDDPKFTALLRYEQAVIPDEEPGAVNRESRLSVGFNYRPVPTVAFKVEYQFNKTQHDPLVNGNSNGMAMSVTGAF